MKWYKQLDSMDCGPTCLRMILEYYNKKVSLQYIREKAQIGKEGVNLLGICDAAESLGFRALAIRIEMEALLNNINLPAILHWDHNHFVVLYKIKSKSLLRKSNLFYIADPAIGLITFNEIDFKNHWGNKGNENKYSGIVLLLEPGSDFYKEDTIDTLDSTYKTASPKLFNYLKPFKSLIIQLLIGMIVASLLQIILPFLTQSIIDIGVVSSNYHFVNVVLLGQLALFAGRLVIEFVRSWVLLHISSRINLSILTEFLMKLLKLPVSFYDSKNTGDILQRMSDHSRIDSFLTGTSLNTLFSIINLIVFTLVLFIFNTNIFWIFFLSSFLYAAWVLLFYYKRRELDHKQFIISSKEKSLTIQLINGMQDIKLNGIEKSIRWNWEGIQTKYFKLRFKILRLNQIQQTGAFFINEGKNIFITFLSAKAVIEGHLSLGGMLAIQYIIGQLNSPIEQLVTFFQNLQSAKLSFERLNEIHKIVDEEPIEKQFRYELPKSFSKQIYGGINTENIIINHSCPVKNSNSCAVM